MNGHLPKKYLLFILVFVNSLAIFSQKLQQYSVDVQGNTYEIYTQEILKHNAATNTDFRFSSKLLGNIHSLDIWNPLRPLIFYKDVQKLVITDNTLSTQYQEVISFEEINMFQILCIASSRVDNGIWVYDQDLFQIVKLSQKLERIIETGNLKQVLGLENLSPTSMIEKNGYLYVHCENNGILIFDIYGTYYKTIPIDNISVWNIFDDKIYYIKERETYVYSLKDFISENLNVTYPKSNNALWIDENFIYHRDNNSVIHKTQIIQN